MTGETNRIYRNPKGREGYRDDRGRTRFPKYSSKLHDLADLNLVLYKCFMFTWFHFIVNTYCECPDRFPRPTGGKDCRCSRNDRAKSSVSCWSR